MKLTWHLIEKDLRRFAWVLVAFTLVILLKLAVGVVLAIADGDLEPRQFNHFETLANLLIILEVGVACVLTAAAIQEDPLVGTRAFWMTRPISGLRLLGAKVLLLAIVFILLPLFVTLPWWWFNGLTSAQIAIAASETAGWHGVTILIALPFAVLTRTLGRFLVATLITLVVLILLQFWIREGAFSSAESKLSPGAAATRVVLLIVLGVSSVVSLVIHQYRTRRSARSFMIAASSVILTAFVVCFWRWDWSGPLDSSPEKPHERISVEIESATRLPSNSRGHSATLAVTLRVTGLSAKHILLGYYDRQTWTLADGHSVTRFGLVRDLSSAALLHEVLQLPPSEPSRNQSSGSEAFRAEAVFAASLLDQLSAEPARLDLEVVFAAMTPRLLGELPLTPGTVIRESGTSLRLVDVSHTESRKTRVALVETFPAAMAEGLARPGALMPARHPRSPDLRIVDRQRNTAIVPEHSGNRIRIAGVGILWRVVTIATSSDAQLAHLRIAKLATGSVDLVKRELSIPSFQVK